MLDKLWNLSTNRADNTGLCWQERLGDDFHSRIQDESFDDPAACPCEVSVSRCQSPIRISEMSLNYAQEKAYKSLQILGSSEGSLRERLESAIVPNFMNLADEAAGHTSGLHEELEAEITELFQQMTRDWSIPETLDNLDEVGLVRVAEQMVSLCTEALQATGEGAFVLGIDRGEN